MARETLELSLDRIFGHEGGLSTDRGDPGNWSSGRVRVGFLGGTKYGVTCATLGRHRGLGRAASLDEIKALTREEAAEIYRGNYWRLIRGDDLPAGLDHMMLDTSIHSGPARSVKILQRVLGVKEDGLVGAQTMAALERFVRERGVEALIRAYAEERMAFLRRLQAWPRYARGWTIRVTGEDPRGQWSRKPGVVGEAIAFAQRRRPAPPPDELMDHLEREGGAAPADERDVAVTKTPEGRHWLLALLAAIASGAGQVTDQLTPYGDIPFVRTILAIAAVAAVGAGLFLAVRRIRRGEGDA